jgi:hypothetical protein
LIQALLICRIDLKKLVDNSVSEKKKKILSWLSTEEINERHEELKSIRTENSGKWFLESDEFINWLDGKGPSCLFAVGIRIFSFYIAF